MPEEIIDTDDAPASFQIVLRSLRQRADVAPDGTVPNWLVIALVRSAYKAGLESAATSTTATGKSLPITLKLPDGLNVKTEIKKEEKLVDHNKNETLDTSPATSVTTATPTVTKTDKRKGPRRPMTDEERKAHSVRMIEIHAKRRTQAERSKNGLRGGGASEIPGEIFRPSATR